MDGAYWAWIPPIRSSIFGSDVVALSRRCCRASTARFSARGVSVRGAV
jgi:hypothetical protein